MRLNNPCSKCGTVTTHMSNSPYGLLCPPCKKKHDDFLAPLIEEANKNAAAKRLMQRECTCCPIHGSPIKLQET